MKLRCYCCGEEIPADQPVVLVSFGVAGDPSDRVMIFSEDHHDYADEANAREFVDRRPGA